MLETRGIQLSRKTLERYLAGSGAYQGAPRPAAVSAPTDAPTGLVAAAAEALEGGDLERLEKSARDVWRAMQGYVEAMGREPSAARAYGTLARLHADLAGKCHELRPRQDVEREAILDAGSAERDVLIERARRAAREDDGIRGKYERARALLERKFSEAS